MRAKERAEARAAAQAARSAEAGAGALGKAILPAATLTVAVLDRKVREVVSSRGRKGADPKSILRQLEGLARLASKFGPRVEVPVLMHSITAQFDLQRTIDDYMTTGTWASCAGYLTRMVGMLEDGEEKYSLGTVSAEEADELLNVAVKGKMKAAAGAAVGDGGAVSAVAADEQLVNPETVRMLDKLE